MKKKLQRLFKEYDLEITAESNLKIVNYLDVTFNLKDGTFRTYHKPDDQMQYIHTESNHPPNIIKHIPASIETRLSNLSSTEIIFRESTTHYENKASNVFDCFLNNYRKAHLDKLNLSLTSKEETSIKIESCIKKAAHPKNN